MKETWIQNNNSKIIIFFNGWGCEAHRFTHLVTHFYDILFLNDYRDLTLSKEVLDEVKSYEEINVIAWSYGVWVGSKVCAAYELPVNYAVAVNGTCMPMHDEYGISEEITKGTLKNLSERNLMKFQRRMVGGSGGWKRFEAEKSHRELAEKKEELAALIQQFETNQGVPEFYNKAIVGKNDLIFAAQNQKAFWQGKVEVVEIEAPHFCFWNYNTWEEILKEDEHD